LDTKLDQIKLQAKGREVDHARVFSTEDHEKSCDCIKVILEN
jgi:hypothetical protein